MKIAICLLLIVVVYAAIPNYVTICQKGANLSKCLLENFKKVTQHLTENGDPTLGLDALRAVKIEQMDFFDRALVTSLYKPTFYGLENTKLDEFTMTDKQIHMKGTIPWIRYYCDYAMEGIMFKMPVKGEGIANGTFSDCEFDYTCRLKTEERNGKKYYYVNNDWNDITINFLAKKSYFDFSNISSSDPKLGTNVNAVLNEHDADAFQEIKVSVEEGFVFFLLHKYINGYLRNIPIENLFRA